MTVAHDLRSEIRWRVHKAPSPFDLNCQGPEWDGYRPKEFVENPSLWSEYQRHAEPLVDVSDLLPEIDWEKNKIVKCRYGAAVLVTTELPMVDVDRGGDPRYDAWCSQRTDDVWEVIARVNRLRHGEYDYDRLSVTAPDLFMYRVYETGGGWRVLILPPRNMPPDSDAFQSVGRFLGCDRRYLQLCATQATWRIRLTEKPWRDYVGGGVAKLVRAFAHKDFELWPSVQALVELHDAMTGRG